MNNGEFEKKIGYKFKDKALLEKALTHSSYCRENGVAARDSNERLEFLGDAFFDAVIGVALYKRLEKSNEGRLTKTRAAIVCEKSLAEVGSRLTIGSFINMGKGEEMSGGRNRESIIADAMEAVIGAIYLDGGYEEVYKFVSEQFADTVENALAGKLFKDYKSQIQEELQKRGKIITITYHLDKTEGPDHDKVFYVHLECNGETLGKGSGKSKKEAEQNAAKTALERGADTYVL